MKKKKCQGCEIPFEENENINRMEWENPKTGRKEMMDFCDFCYDRRLKNIPIDGIPKENHAKRNHSKSR